MSNSRPERWATSLPSAKSLVSTLNGIVMDLPTSIGVSWVVVMQRAQNTRIARGVHLLSTTDRGEQDGRKSSGYGLTWAGFSWISNECRPLPLGEIYGLPSRCGRMPSSRVDSKRTWTREISTEQVVETLLNLPGHGPDRLRRGMAKSADARPSMVALVHELAERYRSLSCPIRIRFISVGSEEISGLSSMRMHLVSFNAGANEPSFYRGLCLCPAPGEMFSSWMTLSKM